MAKSKYPGVYPADKADRWVLRMCYTVNGKTYRDTETVTAKTQKQAYDMMIKLKEEKKNTILTGGTHNTDSKLDFVDLVNKWKEAKRVDIKRGKFSPTTFATYESTLTKYIIPYFGPMLVSSIKASTIYNYIDSIKADYSLSDKTIKNQLMLLRAILTYAVERDMLEYNPMIKVKYEVNKSDDVQYFTPQQLNKIVELLNKDLDDLEISFDKSRKYKDMDKSERDRRANIRILDASSKRLFVSLAIVTGARRGELIGLTWSDIDMENKLIKFKGTSYTLAGEQTKKKETLKNGNKVKDVTLNNSLIPLIDEYKQLQKKVIKQNKWSYNDFVFLTLKDGKINKAGDPIRGDTFTQWFSGWCVEHGEDLGLTETEAKEAHVHMLRHSSISYLLNNGIPLKAVADRSGHNDKDVTDKIYGHIYDETQRTAASMFDNLFESDTSDK